MEPRNLLAAYKVANDNTREVLRTLYPEIAFDDWLKKEQKDNRPVTERIIMFEQAVSELGDNHPLVDQYREIFGNFLDSGDKDSSDLLAYLKLRIVCAALNEGWEPSFAEDELRYYPVHCLWTAEELADMTEDKKRKYGIISTENYQTDFCGFGYAYSNDVPSHAEANIGSRLCFKSRELAIYAGRQFIELYADFNLIRK